MVSSRDDATKRLIDVTLALFALVVSAPIQAVIALLIRRNMGSPVLFQQERPGRFGQPFTLVKFRTMRVGQQNDSVRLTPLGQLLRSTSLDELPTLWNVVKGEMSLVGPRPLLMQYLDLYTPAQARRHEVRPGITGLAQIMGRNSLSWDQRLTADVLYVDHRSVLLDLTIILRTVHAVVSRRGISAHGHPTMPEFSGSTTEFGST